MAASHGVVIPPPGKGILIPNEENQVNRGCRVRNTTAQNIHFVKPPPMANTVPPSRRRVTPASTSETSAADGASNSKSEMTSFSSCGVGIRLSLEGSISFEFCRQPSPSLIESAGCLRIKLASWVCWLSHPACSVRDPELDEPSDTGDRQQRCGRE